MHRDNLPSFVLGFGEAVREVWTEDTANPDSRPLPDGAPSSYGQNAVTTYLLFEQLIRNIDVQPEELLLNIGHVLKTMGGVAVGPHTWISWPRNENFQSVVDPSQILVLDATADLADNKWLTDTVVETYDQLGTRGFLYQSHWATPNMSTFGLRYLHTETEGGARLDLLRERYQQTSFHQMYSTNDANAES